MIKSISITIVSPPEWPPRTTIQVDRPSELFILSLHSHGPSMAHRERLIYLTENYLVYLLKIILLFTEKVILLHGQSVLYKD